MTVDQYRTEVRGTWLDVDDLPDHLVESLMHYQLWRVRQLGVELWRLILGEAGRPQLRLPFSTWIIALVASGLLWWLIIRLAVIVWRTLT
jgi:hypothetical protein